MKKKILIAAFCILGFLVNAQNCFTAATTLTTGTWPSAVFSADFNSDGYKDIVTTNVTSSNLVLYFGSLTGTFSPGTSIPLPNAAWDIVTGDFNSDGNLDIATANSGTSSIVILLGTGLGTFTSTTAYPATTPQVVSLACADFNGDGKLDIVTEDFNSNVFYLLLGIGNGAFAAPVSFPTGGSYPKSIHSADFNGDGKKDIAIANGISNDVSVLFSTGTGSFVLNGTYAVGSYPYDIASADFNGDGKLDLAVCNSNGPNLSILLGSASGTFAAAVNYSSGGNSASYLKEADINNDSFLDVVVANFNGNNISVFFNNGSAVFSTTKNYSVGTNPSGIYSADFNNDGKMDIVSANKNSNDISILMNFNFSVSVSASSPAICLGNSATLTTSGAATYTWNTGSNASSIVVSPAINTNYTVSGTSAQGCAATASQAIIVNPNPTAGATNNGPICSGNNLNFTNSSTGAVSYLWSGPNSFSSGSTNAIIVSATNLNSGTYSLTSTSSAGCAATATMAVVVNTTPTLAVNSGSICSGQGFTMVPSGASTYSYSSGSAGVGPLVTTSYSVTGTSAQGCVASNTAVSTITVNANPTITVNSGSICSGKSFTIIASGASTYTYSSGTAIVSPLATTNYSVTGTSAQGCVSPIASVSGVTVNISPTITVNSGSLCSGQSFTLNGAGANTYTYSGGTNIVSPLTNTAYSVTGTSAQGCAATNTAVSNVTVNISPTITVNSGSICSGQNFTMVPGGASTYSFSAGGSVVAPVTNTVFFVTGTSAQGCLGTNTATSSITVNANPTITVNSGSICSGKSFTMIAGGANTYTYSGGTNIVSPLAMTNYSVTGTSAQGCVSPIAAVSNITVNTTPTVTVNSGTLCTGQSFTLNGAGATTYTYSSGSNIVSPLSNTNYSVTGTSAQGCVSSNTAVSNVTVNITPTITVTNGTICSGQNFTMVPSGASTYSFSSGGSVVAPSTTTVFFVTGTSAQGCLGANTATSSITVNANPTITVNSGSICSGQSFTLTAGGANTYTYSSGSNVVAPLLTTNYSVTGTSTQGCVSPIAAVSNVTVNTTPTITVNSGSLCAGQSFTLNGGGASTYTYSGGTNIVSPLANASYSVTGTSAQGCVATNTAAATLTVYANPTITVNSGAICSGDSFTISPSGAVSYTYSGGSNIVSPLSNTNYSITGTSLQGCISATFAISTVTVNPNPTVAVNSGSICSGQSFTLLPSGASTYTYSSGSNVVTPVANTNYSVIGLSAQGCVSSNTAVSSVTVNPNPLISVNSGSICSGQSFVLVVGGANAYTLNPGSLSGNAFTINPAATTQYSVVGTSTAGCVSSIPALATVTVNPLTSISGFVTSSLIPVAGEITLFYYKPFLSKFSAVSTQTLNGAGGYSFNAVSPGAYILQAFPSSGSLQVTYGSSSISWKTASNFNHNCINNTSHPINVIPITNIGSGPGSLSGKITEGVGYGQRGSNVATPGNPIGGVIVKGGRNPGGDVVSQGKTNASGQYTLTGMRLNLPNESYFVMVEIPGLDTNNTYHRVIFTGSESYENLDFTVDSTKINAVDLTVGVNELSIANANVFIYPNPASNKITISCDLKKSADVEIELMDISGRIVQSLLPKSHQVEGEVKIIAQLKEIQEGIYFVRLKVAKEERMVKLIVTE